ncbi:hypothetical protein [Carboxylicivirga sp. N1Y90]|uniref:hypothetical protein n=1 Tax=Carboxylicivirga fragile TaxID=3417571 RepID=UPI003D336CD8|nr:hypothetical protein [Marinilabiliaceae bacterium N1Y90]
MKRSKFFAIIGIVTMILMIGNTQKVYSSQDELTEDTGEGINAPWERVCHPERPNRCTWRALSNRKECTKDYQC